MKNKQTKIATSQLLLHLRLDQYKNIKTIIWVVIIPLIWLNLVYIWLFSFSCLKHDFKNIFLQESFFVRLKHDQKPVIINKLTQNIPFAFHSNAPKKTAQSRN